MARTVAQQMIAQRMAAQRAAGQNHALTNDDAAQNQFAAQQNPAEGLLAASAQGQGTDEKLMAAVDQDVSQQVPSAMEPLAQLMEEGASQ